MQGIKKINNNVALCIDSQGRQVLAMGKGIGFGSFPKTIGLAEIERTFYHINDSHIQLVQDVPEEVLQLSDEVIKQAQNLLPYAISPNATLSMADHIHFAIQRMEQKIKVQMPLAYDVQLQYPVEMEIAENALMLIRKKLHQDLPKSETVGIALSLVNAKISTANAQESENQFDDMLRMVTETIEKHYDMQIDRSTFHYARFASHIYYLYQRICQKRPIDTENMDMYLKMKDSYPKAADCVSEIAREIQETYGEELSHEEQLYLMLHVNRVLVKEQN